MVVDDSNKFKELAVEGDDEEVERLRRVGIYFKFIVKIYISIRMDGPVLLINYA